MADYYQIKSSLSQITETKMNEFILSLSKELGEPLERVPLEKYLEDDFALLYVASGGSEGYFLEVFDSLKSRPCYILTSGDSNSLAASMEILSFIRQNGGRGEILHGSIKAVAARIKALKAAHTAKAKLFGTSIGCIGAPSDWLISSGFDPSGIGEKLNMGFVSIDISELLAEYEKKEYTPNRFTDSFLTCSFNKAETEKALWVYGAFRRICDKYSLSGVTVRCFDLLDTIFTTGCLGLSILNCEGIYGGCEGDIPSLISMAVLGAVSGEPCFLCNPSRFDIDSKTATFAHCTVPVTMLENFTLNTHFESGIGAAVQGAFAEGPCTVFKCSGSLSRYHAQAGLIIPAEFSDMLCRSQIKVALDDFSYFLTDPIGNHHIICRGDHTQALADLFDIL